MGYIEKIVQPIFGQPQAVAKNCSCGKHHIYCNAQTQKDKGYLEMTAIGFQQNKRNAVETRRAVP